MPIHRKSLLHCCALLFLAGASADASILTFDITNQTNYGPITTYGTRINSLSDADGSYLQGNAFTPNIVTSYRTVDPGNQSTLTNQLDSWDLNYGDLVNVAFASSSGYLAEVTLTPDAGYAVLLNSFDIAGWLGTFKDQPLVIYDKDYNILLDLSGFTAPETGHASFTPGVSFNGAIHIQFSNNWNVGIDNINFDQRFVGGSAVPEPSTLLSAAFAGLAALVGYRRSRRS